MGRAYALNAGEPKEVANAVRDHYRPIGAEGAGRRGRRLGVRRARRSPRHARRLLRGRSVADRRGRSVRAPPRVHRDAAHAARALEGQPRVRASSRSASSTAGPTTASRARSSTSRARTRIAKLREFTFERLRGLIASATSSHVADAVCSGGVLDHPVYALARAKAVHSAVTEGKAWLGQARTVAKRLSGISKESKPILHAKDAFEKEDDAVIVDVVAKVDASTKELHTEAAVSAALAQAEGFRGPPRRHLHPHARQRPERRPHAAPARAPVLRRPVHAADRGFLEARLIRARNVCVGLRSPYPWGRTMARDDPPSKPPQQVPGAAVAPSVPRPISARADDAALDTGAGRAGRARVPRPTPRSIPPGSMPPRSIPPASMPPLPPPSAAASMPPLPPSMPPRRSPPPSMPPRSMPPARCRRGRCPRVDAARLDARPRAALDAASRRCRPRSMPPASMPPARCRRPRCSRAPRGRCRCGRRSSVASRSSRRLPAAGWPRSTSVARREAASEVVALKVMRQTAPRRTRSS